MYKSDVDLISKLAKNKSKLCVEKPIEFLLRGVMAGLYLGVAIILSYTVGALMNNLSVEIGKIASAMTFSIAIVLICFLGGELFTGSNLIMGIGLYSKEIKVNEVMKVFTITYLGNLIGNVIISFIFVASNSNGKLISVYLDSIIKAKLSLTNLEMLLKGILCNFIVCISVLASIKMKSESAKIQVMFWCIFAFVIGGFEHSIANMGIFSMGVFMGGNIPVLDIINSMFWVTLGNIIGGMFLYAFTLHGMAVE